mmetsp:Transcript_10252/g.34847  ORF Transcript_10252/g.34847 Transcript_10252/m.34847 type:complete len:245 (+) Transcript_10252:51-785(+)
MARVRPQPTDDEPLAAFVRCSREAKTPPSRPLSSWGDPHSTMDPSESTMIESELMIVTRRCAIVIVVLSDTSSRRVCWISMSVSWSMDAVASSSTSTRDGRKRARPRHSSCRWPTLRLQPPAVTVIARPSTWEATTGDRWHRRRAVHTSSSVCSSKGSRLERTVPEKSTGSCGMMESALRSVLRSRLDVSMPSMRMHPELRGTMRYSASRREVFPEPVRPTTPTLAPAGIWQLRSLSTRGRSGR